MQSRSARGRLCLVVAVAACLCGPRAAATAPDAFPVTAELDRYGAGDYVAFFDVLSRAGDLQQAFARFAKEASAWTKRPDVEPGTRRVLVAAAVALEIAHLLRSE